MLKQFPLLAQGNKNINDSSLERLKYIFVPTQDLINELVGRCEKGQLLVNAQ